MANDSCVAGSPTIVNSSAALVSERVRRRRTFRRHWWSRPRVAPAATRPPTAAAAPRVTSEISAGVRFRIRPITGCREETSIPRPQLLASRRGRERHQGDLPVSLEDCPFELREMLQTDLVHGREDVRNRDPFAIQLLLKQLSASHENRWFRLHHTREARLR